MQEIKDEVRVRVPFHQSKTPEKKEIFDQALIEQIAKICHEANRAYCETLGDMSQLPWNDAETWQKDSAVAGVRFKLENPSATPESQHKEWLKKKIVDGWKVGRKKDVEKKEHPCMVSYEVLPLEQRMKDHIFGAIVEAFIKGRKE